MRIPIIRIILVLFCVYTAFSNWETIKYDTKEGIVTGVFPIHEKNKLIMALAFQNNSKIMRFDLLNKTFDYLKFQESPLITSFCKDNDDYYVNGLNPFSPINYMLKTTNFIDFENLINIGSSLIINTKKINKNELILLGAKSYSEMNLPFLAKYKISENSIEEKNYDNLTTGLLFNSFKYDESTFFLLDNIGNLFVTYDTFENLKLIEKFNSRIRDFFLNNDTIYLAGDANLLKIYDLKNKVFVDLLNELPNSSINFIEIFSFEDQLFTFGRGSTQSYLFKIVDGKLIEEFSLSFDSYCFPDTNYIVIASEDGNIKYKMRKGSSVESKSNKEYYTMKNNNNLLEFYFQDINFNKSNNIKLYNIEGKLLNFIELNQKDECIIDLKQFKINSTLLIEISLDGKIYSEKINLTY